MMNANPPSTLRLMTKFLIFCALTSALTNSSYVVHAAGEKEAVPDSLDPLLRVVPLEKERIRPNPTPNLKIPSRPGFQTVVLRDYASVTGQKDIAPPVVLYVPSIFYHKPSDHSFEVWGLNFLLFWPGLTPIQDHPECVPFTCDTVIILAIKLTMMDIAANKYNNLINEIKIANTEKDPPVLYEHAMSIPGFSESYATTNVHLPQNMNRKKRIFIARDVDNKIISYTECLVDAPKPTCRTDRKSNSYPDINVTYIANMKIFLSEYDVLQKNSLLFVENMVQYRK